MSGDSLRTVTLLMTDVVGSTKLWEKDPEGARQALRLHDRLAEEIVSKHGGQVLKKRGEGDSLFCVFEEVWPAVDAAIEFNKALSTAKWPHGRPLAVRCAINTGPVDERDEDAYGATVNHCARLRGAIHGEQICLTESAKVALAERATTRDLGIHRFRDLSRPERVHQVLAEGLRSEFPPLNSLDLHPHNLPIQLTPFIGREKEKRKAGELLRENRLVTLTGPGGSGKTRLALQVAAESLDSFPAGVWFVELADLRDPAFVAAACCRTVGLTSLGDSCKELSEYLADEPHLLVLDNCEHLLDGAREVVTSLLRQCPGTKIIATSREVLGAMGECKYEVPSMGFRSAGGGLSEIAQLDAVLLFCSMAAKRKPGFELTETNAEDVAWICGRLEGIPLAIEQVASHIDFLSAKQLRARLQEHFDLLDIESEAHDARHRTLQATIGWSYNTLSDSEKELFARLSVFAGGWTLEAAEEICSSEDLPQNSVLRLLQILVRKSLVTVEESVDGVRRYRFLETVREFATEQQSDRRRLAQRHCQFFQRLADENNDKLVGADQAEAIKTFDREYENIRIALICASDQRRSLDLALSLRRYWLARALLNEGFEILSQALADSEESTRQKQATAFNALGAICFRMGKYGSAKEHYEQSQALWVAEGARHQVVTVLHNLALVEIQVGDREMALHHLEEVLKLYGDEGDEVGVARTLASIGRLQVELGRYRDAASVLDDAVPKLDRAGLTDMSAVARAARAEAYIGLEDFHAGALDLAEAFSTWKEVEDRSPMVTGLLVLAKALMSCGKQDLSVRIRAHAEALQDQIGADFDEHQRTLLRSLPSRGESLQAANQSGTEAESAILAALSSVHELVTQCKRSRMVN